MLQGLNGTEALHLIRRQNERVPALVARDALSEEVWHFEIGGEEGL